MSELVVANDHEALRAIGPWLATVLAPVDDAVRTAMLTRAELAIHELATNSVDHSNSRDASLRLQAHLEAGSLRVELTDRGDAVDVASIPAPDLDQPQIRGYGMMIVEQLVSDLSYERADGRNIWTATFDLPTDAHASPQE